MSAATTTAATVVARWFTRTPMTSRRLVKRTSGMSANGIPKESTTWLITSVRDGSTPIPTTMSAGSIVTRRRTATGICRRMKPCMTTWPESVPTVELERPDASSASAKRLLVRLGPDPVLEQRGVKVDHVRHDRCAEDSDREQHRLSPGELRHHRVVRDRAERRLRLEDLAEVADADEADDGGDRRLEGPEPEALEPEDREGGHAGDERGREEPDPEQEVEAERGAEDLGEVGRHRDHLGLEPEADRRPARAPLATDLGEVP